LFCFDQIFLLFISVLALGTEVDIIPMLQGDDVQPYVAGSLFRDKLLFHKDVAGNWPSECEPQVERDVFITMRH